MILSHLKALSEHPRYRHAHKLIFIESNMSYIGADLVATWCRRVCFAPVIIESRDPTPRGRVGVWTGTYEKESYAWLGRDIIEQDELYYASEMIGGNIERDKESFVKQLRQFRMERQDPADLAFGKFKYAYTGKTGGGNKDDLVLAWQIATYWGRRKREDPTFLAWCKQQGYRTS
jgi:hypothetical protein